MGEAFGGKNPKLKVNRLQTESEQNVQRGIESLLRGIYQAIRNPRSHGKHQDDERDAVAILFFIDYLVRIVGKANTPFSLSACVKKVIDPGFVPKERYAKLIFEEIPEKKRLATCLEVFAKREHADGQKVRYFFDIALGSLSEEERKEFYSVVSEELRQTEDGDTVRFVIQALPHEAWKEIDELARLRVEHKLINSVREGRWIRSENRCRRGALGTWSTSLLDGFLLKEDLWAAVFDKLASTDRSEQDYAILYFLQHAPVAFDSPPSRLVVEMISGLRNGDIRFKELIASWELNRWPEENDPWVKPFEQALEAFHEAEAAMAAEPDDELPF